LRPVTFDAMNYDDVTFRSRDRKSRDSAPRQTLSAFTLSQQYRCSAARNPSAQPPRGNNKALNFATDRTALLLIWRVLTFYADRAMQKKRRADGQLRLPQTLEPRTGQ